MKVRNRMKPSVPSTADHTAESLSNLRQPTSSPPRRRPRWRRYIGPKRLIGVTGLLLLAVCGWYMRSTGMLDPADIVRMVETHPGMMVFGFVVLFAAAVTTALPTLPLNLAAGFLWGPILGGILSTTGATVGATVAFLLTRSLLGPVLARRFDNRFLVAVQRELQLNGWRFLAFVRLNPVFPTGPLNYVLGLTALSLRTYVWSTFCFLLVPSWIVALVGHQLGTFVLDDAARDVVRTLLVICGAAGLLVGIKYASVILRDIPRGGA